MPGLLSYGSLGFGVHGESNGKDMENEMETGGNRDVRNLN